MEAPLDRQTFVASLREDPYTAGYLTFLVGQQLLPPERADLRNANDLSLAALSAVSLWDKVRFERVYIEIAHRTPKATSHWLYNDWLLFALSIGVVAFTLDAGWLLGALRVRSDSASGEARDISRTLTDIVNENWGSTDNLRPLVLVARHLLGHPLRNEDLLNGVYLDLTDRTFPYHDSQFLNAVCIRALDVVILSKAPKDPARERALAAFVATFRRRTHASAVAGWWAGLLALLGLVGTVLWITLELPDTQYEVIDRVITVLAPGSIVALVFFYVARRRKVIGWLEGRILFRLFGFDAAACSSGDVD